MKIAFIPTNLDLEQFVKERLPAFAWHLEDFYYILGTIVNRMGYREDNLDEDSDFAPLNAQLLQSRIRNYNQYLTYLVEHKIVETDNQYIVGKKARGYRISDEYIQQGFVQKQLTLKRLIKYSENQKRGDQWVEKEYAYLTKWFNNNLQIDYKGAIECLERLLEADIKKGLGVREASRKYELRKLALDKLNSGLFSYSVDGTSYRFHSNLTTIKSELRKYITYAGEQLCSVDLKNSQPFISTIFLNPAFYEENNLGSTLFSINKTLFLTLNKQINQIKSILTPISNIIMLVKPDVIQCSTDLERYCTLVDKGRIYAYFADNLEMFYGMSYDITNQAQKRELKDEFFRMLYSDNRSIRFSKTKILFKSLFPNVHKIFNLIKQRGKNNLPIILQMIESEVIIRRVAKRFNSEYPEVPIFSIHDSLVTLNSHKELVYQRLKQEFHTAIGVQPTLQYEPWTPEKLVY